MKRSALIGLLLVMGVAGCGFKSQLTDFVEGWPTNEPNPVREKLNAKRFVELIEWRELNKQTLVLLCQTLQEKKIPYVCTSQQAMIAGRIVIQIEDESAAKEAIQTIPMLGPTFVTQGTWGELRY